jgi:hypothetical protein
VLPGAEPPDPHDWWLGWVAWRSVRRAAGDRGWIVSRTTGCGVRVSMPDLGSGRWGSSPCFPTLTAGISVVGDDSLAQLAERPVEARCGQVRVLRESLGPGYGGAGARPRFLGPTWPTSIVAMCQPSKLASRVRSPGGPRSCSASCAPLAQLAERRTLNPLGRGSNPWRRTRAWRNRQPRQAQTLVSVSS